MGGESVTTLPPWPPATGRKHRAPGPQGRLSASTVQVRKSGTGKQTEITEVPPVVYHLEVLWKEEPLCLIDLAQPG